MQTDLSHLPEAKQRELAEIVRRGPQSTTCVPSIEGIYILIILLIIAI